MILSLIVAMSENRVIGKDNKLPWHIPADLKRFKQITSGHPIIMGRKTFESIGKPLPNRTNIVISRTQTRTDGTVAWCQSLEQALEIAKESEGSEETFVIGGAEIFRLALPYVNKIYFTKIHQIIEGDVFLPDLKEETFRCSHREWLDKDAKAELLILEK